MDIDAILREIDCIINDTNNIYCKLSAQQMMLFTCFYGEAKKRLCHKYNLLILIALFEMQRLYSKS